MKCYVFDAPKGEDRWVESYFTVGAKFRVRGGQIVFKKKDADEYMPTIFSVYDLHNDYPSDNYPDFDCQFYDASKDIYYNGSTRIYPLDMFNRWQHNMGYDGGSKYDVNENVEVYNSSGNLIQILEPDVHQAVVGNGYGNTSMDGHPHDRISISGWYRISTGEFINQHAWIDHDPTQYPSEHGLDTW
ncbi:hypothetical protein [Sporolactobacillus nakayamae]|uniref:Uncharacterized protein n=1 Tax=Sporolactobacillus nakayamae TaxID=269670 RepID=A0A1I2QLT6_9BACL|nr:hypothetical protein [Sporolactobacillus nakayamae]SFG29248.1 hypothetical protein SAMN02982927_01280 [Sporolactobacillus nakayamae]